MFLSCVFNVFHLFASFFDVFFSCFSTLSTVLGSNLPTALSVNCTKMLLFAYVKHSGPSFFFVEGSPACIHRLPFAGFELCLVVPASFGSNMTPSMTSTLKEAKRQRWLDHYLAEKLTKSQRIMLQGSKPDLGTQHCIVKKL